MGTKLCYQPGSHYEVCDRTGMVFRAEDMRTEWTGARVYKEVFEARHPQDFVRGRPDNQAVIDGRPRQTDVFLTPNEVEPNDYPSSMG